MCNVSLGVTFRRQFFEPHNFVCLVMSSLAFYILRETYKQWKKLNKNDKMTFKNRVNLCQWKWQKVPMNDGCVVLLTWKWQSIGHIKWRRGWSCLDCSPRVGGGRLHWWRGWTAPWTHCPHSRPTHSQSASSTRCYNTTHTHYEHTAYIRDPHSQPA